MPISSWRCWPWLSIGDRLVRDAVEMDAMHDALGRSERGVVARAAAAGEAAARHAAAREKEIVEDAEAAEQQGNLVGAPQAAADALVRRQGR